jgi:hypothetical protein
VSRTHDNQASLESLQASIYRDKIERARRMTDAERIAEVLELSNRQLGMMLAGAMDRLGTEDEAEGWKEVGRWLRRLDQVRDHGRYVRERPRRHDA